MSRVSWIWGKGALGRGRRRGEASGMGVGDGLSHLQGSRSWYWLEPKGES